MNNNEVNGQVRFNNGDIIRFPSNVDIVKKHREDLKQLQEQIKEGKGEKLFKAFVKVLTRVRR